MARKYFLVLFLLTAFLILATGTALAIYSWVDEKGVYHISDNPKPNTHRDPEPRISEKRAVDEPVQSEKQAQKNEPPPPQQESSKPTVAQPAPALQQPKIQVPAQQQSQTGAVAAPVPIPQNPSTPPTVTPPSPHRVPAMPGIKEPNAEMLAAFAAFGTVFLLLAAAAYIYISLCMYIIAKKLNVSAAWTAWVPILNFWPLFASAGKPIWWVIFILIPLVNIFIITYLWMCIAENLGKNKWLGLLILVPIANVVLPGLLAFSSEGRSSPSASTA